MNLANIIQQAAKKIIIPVTMLASSFAHGQNYDSTSVHVDNGTPFGKVEFFSTDNKDSIPTNSYFLNLDANGQGDIKLPIHPSIGMQEYTFPKNSISAFPNPTSNQANILFDQDLTGNQVNYTVSNLAGQRVMQGTDNDGRIELNLGNQADGMYLVTLENEQGGSATRKIVKSRQARNSTPQRVRKSFADDNDPMHSALQTPTPNDANYQVKHLLPDGFVNVDSNYIFALGQQNNVNFNWNPWDTTFVNAYWDVVSNGNALDSVAITAKPVQMDDILVNAVYKDTTNNGVTGATDFIAHVDTMGQGPANPNVVYEVTAKKDGFVTTTQQINLQAGQNQLVMNPWDTAYASGIATLKDNQNIFAKFVPLTLEIDSMQQINTGLTWNDTSSASGELTIANKPIAIDTTGAPANTSGTIKISWPETIRYDIDSTSVSQTYMGWHAGDTTLTFSPGLNQPQSINLQQKPMPSIVGEEYLQFQIGQFDRYHNLTPADSALIIVHNQTQNTTDSLFADTNGVAHYLANHNDQLLFGAGYDGSVGTNGEALQMAKGVPVTAQGVTLNRLAANDTVQKVMLNLVPDTVHVDENAIYVSAYDRRQMSEQPSLMNQFDTVYYNINQTVNGGFTAGQEANIDAVADSASKILPITLVKSSTALPNGTYDPNTFSNTTHGMNIFKGTNNIANIKQTNTAIIGEPISYVTADVEIDGGIDEAWKEMLYQYYAFDGVPITYKPSVTNGNSVTPTYWDFANFTTKHFFEKEMFDATPTQNIGIQHYYDDNSISPQ